MKAASGAHTGQRAVGIILALTLVAALVSSAHVLMGYGRWAQRRAAMPPEQRLSLVAGPTASWLPAILAATPPQAAILLVTDEMRDPDWLTAYYLYPRRLHVVTPRQVRERSAGLPAASFILQRGQLMRWPDLGPVATARDSPARQPAAATDLPPRAPSLRGLLALLVTLISAVGWGALLLQALSPPMVAILPRHGRWGLALLAGCGTLGLAGFLAAFFSLAAGATLTVLLTLGGLASLLPARHWLLVAAPGGRSGASPWRLPRRAGLLLMAILVAAGLGRALGEPMHHWDERFQWSYKAKILLHEGGVGGPGFQEPDRPHLHRRYPLLIPALEAHTARLAGGFSQERAVKGIFPALFAGLLLTLHAALRQRLPREAAWVPALLCAALPAFHLATRIQGGPVHTGFADLPVAAFATGLALCLLPGRSGTARELRPAWAAAGLFAGFILATKPEGVAFLLAALAAATALCWRHPQERPSGRELAQAGLLVGVSLLAVAALHGLVPTAGTVGYTGDENYLSRLTPGAVLQGLRTNLPTAALALLTAPFTPHWSFFGLLPVATLAAGLGMRRATGGSHLLIILIALPLAADLLALTLTGSEVRWQLTVARDRLWLQLAPLLILVAAGRLGRLRDGGGRLQRGTSKRLA